MAWVTPNGGDADGDGVAGFFVSPDGFIITCGHAMQGVKSVDVAVNGGASTVRGEVVQVDAETDLALIKATAGGRYEWLPVFDGDLTVGMHLRAVRGSSLVEAKFDHWENFGHDLGLAGNVSAWDCGTPLITDDGRVAGVVRGSMGERTAAAVASPVWDVVKLMPQLPGLQKKGDEQRKP